MCEVLLTGARPRYQQSQKRQAWQYGWQFPFPFHESWLPPNRLAASRPGRNQCRSCSLAHPGAEISVEPVCCRATLDGMTAAIPPRDDLGRLAQASLRNAQDLLADARLLAGAGRFPTAHAVATLALEEAGKASLCILVLLPSASVLDDEGFWQSWRDHAAKLLWAASVLSVLVDEPDGPLSEVLARLTDESRAAHLRKLRGFYVDYSSRNAAVLLPSEIGADEAEDVMSDVQAALDFMMPAWGHDGFLDRLREMAAYEDQIVELHAGIMRRIEADPDAGLADFRHWFDSQRSSAEPG